MYLNPDQIQIVEHDVQMEGISYSHLEYDLLDHVCCDIEDRMQMGISFEEAYYSVKQDIGIAGLRRVQQETLLLINKNYRMMKKSMKTLGTIALATTAIAALAKIMHWPGAGILVLFSSLMVSAVFFPAALYVWYKEVFNKKHVFIVILVFLSGFIFMNGTLFKINHWPYANILLITGELLTILTILIGGISFLLSKRAKSNPKALLITGIVGLVGFTLGTLFKLEHWPGATIMLIVGSILLFSIFLPVYAYHTYKNEKTVSNSFIFSVFALTSIITFTFLLSIRSERGILDGFVYMDNEIHNSIKITEKQINNIPGSSKSLNEINQKANELFKSITELKRDLVLINGGVDVDVNQLCTEDLEHLKNLYQSEETRVLLEGNNQKGKAYLLFNDIHDYKLMLIKTSENNASFIDFMDSFLSLNQKNAQDWVRLNVYFDPLVITLNNLTQLQLDIRLTQQEVLSLANNALAVSQKEITQE